MIIDSHVHFTPPGMLDRLAETGDEPYWEFIMTPDPKNQTEQDFVTAERMIADMDAAGIDQVFLQAGYQQSHRGCVEANNTVFALAGEFEGRIIPFVSISPAEGPAALEELERCRDLGARGVGELNPYAQNCRLDSPQLRALADRCSEYGMPMTIHMSEETGRFYFGKSTPRMGDYYEFAKTVPDLKLIFAHWGGGLLFYEIMPIVSQQLAHVSYDTASSPMLYPTPDIFRLALDAMPVHKILYGSDYPLRITHEQDDATFLPFLDQIDSLGLPADARAAIMGGNAEWLLDAPTARTPTPVPPAHRALAAGAEESRALADRLELPVDPFTSVATVARRYPRTIAVFEKFDIPAVDSVVPIWEPIVQSAAARGLPKSRQAELIDELNRVIGS